MKIIEISPKPIIKCKGCQIKISNKSKTGHCPKCQRKNSRIVERPSYEILMEEIDKLGYVQVGKKYQVSDNAIRKWVRNYNDLPRRK